MAGCTDLAFRRVARRFGCRFAFTEMVKDRPVCDGLARTFDRMRTEETDRPLGMQLVGREPGMLAEAAKRLEELGADVVDLNLGCPVPKVVKSGCGSALLKEPDRVARIVEAMARAVKVPVTVKMRTGFNEEDDRGFLEIARRAGEAGAAALTVHGRSRRQMYRGLASHEAIRAVKEAAAVPVIGNGDIRSGADARRMMEATGCDGVMLARGTLGNPWIYREAERALEGGEPGAPPSVRERAAVLREHFAHLRELYGDDNACTFIRRVIHWFVRGVHGAPALRQAGSRVVSPERFEEVAARFEAATPPSEQSGRSDEQVTR